MDTILQGGGATSLFETVDVELTVTSTGTYSTGNAAKEFAADGKYLCAFEFLKLTAEAVDPKMDEYENTYISVYNDTVSFSFQPRVPSDIGAYPISATAKVRIYMQSREKLWGAAKNNSIFRRLLYRDFEVEV